VSLQKPFGGGGGVCPQTFSGIYVQVDSRTLARLSFRIGSRSCQGPYYHVAMLRYHVAFYLPKASGDMVVAEALDFPGAVTQGFDLPDARLMISSALEDLAQALLEEGKPLPVPSEEAHGLDADLIELVPLSVHAGIAPK
jgi:predicted RNase H-like HicB family nuclease